MSSVRKAMRNAGIAGVIIAALAGCSGAKSTTSAQPLSFSGRGVIGLDVASIEVVERYRGSASRPHVDHLASPTPTQAVRQWVAERLRATGHSGSAKVLILDASIVESELPRTEGFKAMFTNQQAQRYDGRIEVKIVGEAQDRRFSGSGQASASRSTTVAEDISLAGREDTWNTMTRQLMEDLDGRLQQALREGLRPILRQ